MGVLLRIAVVAIRINGGAMQINSFLMRKKGSDELQGWMRMERVTISTQESAQYGDCAI